MVKVTSFTDKKEIVVLPRLISISGSVHSGKTTISRMLAVNMPNAFYIDGDLISAWVGQKFPKNTPINDLLPETHLHITKLIYAGLKDGLDVIVDYPFSDRIRNQIVQSLGDVEFEAKWFILRPDIKKVLSGSETRPELNEWEKERIDYHYNKSDLLKTSVAKVIDSTKQTSEETLSEIMEEL